MTHTASSFRAAALLLPALLSLPACKKSPTPEDAGVADAGPAVKRPAPSPPRSCDGYAACLAACDGGSGPGCYDAALAMLELRLDGGRDLTVVTPLTTRACELGDGRGCARSGDARADVVLSAQCADAGVLDTTQLEACELLTTWRFEHDAGADALMAGARATSQLEARCTTQPWACARLGSALLHGTLGRADVPRAITLLEKACDDGVAGACVEVGLVFLRGFGGVLPDPARAAKASRSARELTQQVP